WPATRFGRSRFDGEPARAMFAGCAAHSMQPLSGLGTTAFGLMLMMLGHGVGWPVARGGSQAVADAMASVLRVPGRGVVTGAAVRWRGELAGARAVLFDLAPRQVERICGDALPDRYRRALRGFRYGPGVFKIDYALSEPMPWTAPDARRAGTVHVGGTLGEV